MLQNQLSNALFLWTEVWQVFFAACMYLPEWYKFLKKARKTTNSTLSSRIPIHMWFVFAFIFNFQAELFVFGKRPFWFPGRVNLNKTQMFTIETGKQAGFGVLRKVSKIYYSCRLKSQTFWPPGKTRDFVIAVSSQCSRIWMYSHADKVLQ